jgi:hypothetical protein
MSATKTSKKRRTPRRSLVNPKPPKTISGVVVSLAGDMYGANVQIKGAKVNAVAAKINNALKTGKLIELDGQWIAPAHVTSVKATKWQDYGL